MNEFEFLKGATVSTIFSYEADHEDTYGSRIITGIMVHLTDVNGNDRTLFIDASEADDDDSSPCLWVSVYPGEESK